MLLVSPVSLPLYTGNDRIIPTAQFSTHKTRAALVLAQRCWFIALIVDLAKMASAELANKEKEETVRQELERAQERLEATEAALARKEVRTRR